MPFAFSELGMLVMDQKLKSLSYILWAFTKQQDICILFPFYENSDRDLNETAKFSREWSFKVLCFEMCYLSVDTGPEVAV